MIGPCLTILLSFFLKITEMIGNHDHGALSALPLSTFTPLVTGQCSDLY